MHKALYRVYRPKNFSDVIGQEHIVRTLKNQIENIIWHIENNREVSGDTIVLNDVLKALKNIEKRLK